MKILHRCKQPGKLVQNGVHLERHEYEMVQILLWYCKIITLISKSNILYTHTPDIEMDGLSWELKRLRGNGKYVITNLVKRALRQSENVIIDIRHTDIPENKCIRELEKIYNKQKKLKKLLIITKGKKVIDINANS